MRLYARGSVGPADAVILQGRCEQRHDGGNTALYELLRAATEVDHATGPVRWRADGSQCDFAPVDMRYLEGTRNRISFKVRRS